MFTKLDESSILGAGLATAPPCWPNDGGVRASTDLIVLSMIEVARREHPHCSWMMGDIWDWAETEQARFDVVFSNAVLQWVPDHASLYPVILLRAVIGLIILIFVAFPFSITCLELSWVRASRR
jgi:hypothetical protein